MKKSQVSEDEIISAVRDFAYSIHSGRKVNAAMSTLTHMTSQLTFTSFDYWEGMIRFEYASAIRECAIPQWKFWSKPQNILTWLDVISWDGHKREKALRALSGPVPNAFFFSLVLRRLNDWVPQVREAAKEKLPEIAKASDPKFVVDTLCAVLPNWSSWGRIEPSGQAVLLEIMCEKETAESLRAKLISSPAGPMPSLFSQLGRTPILDGRIGEIATCAVQPSLRAKAYRSLFDCRIVWMAGRKWVWTDKRYHQGSLKPILAERKIDAEMPFLTLLKLSSADPSSIVRRVSAEMLIRELDSLGSVAKDFADVFASDKSIAVSERGEFALKKLKEAAY
ncbi:hypothetical protein KDD30_08215 [Photobacterium sp. GJ3]|uniref:hypothetical protein n=1 Tax=Photobacterium sp. GJ3 TaxID=2829502 RepID=UPI001B8B5C52|nr:hypothetical protein [Photobacterium sp. GJ3]QUJ66185.1 hypothetical protein KDD30_08215 [Photobacterium sp. GJ3]